MITVNTPLHGSLVPCVVYVRVSSDEQAKEEHYSLAAQEEMCMAQIKQRDKDGWFYLTTISDPGFSGNLFDRPGLLELLALVKAGKVGMVVVYKRERLFRNADLAFKVQSLLDLYQVKVLSCTEGLHDSSPHSVLVRQIIDANAQYERANGRRRQFDCLRYAASKGDWKGGTAPYGYEYDRLGRTLKIIQAEARNVVFIFEQIAEGSTSCQVANQIRRMGVRGRQPTDNPSPDARSYFMPDKIIRMIRLPTYRGIVRVRKSFTSGSTKDDKNPDWEEFQGRHPAIIQDELWFKANRALDRHLQLAPKRVVLRKSKYPQPLLGLVRCSNCDYSMVPGYSANAYTKRKMGYYRCLRKKQGKELCPCTTGQISAAALETTVTSVMNLMQANPQSFARKDSEATAFNKRREAQQLKEEIQSLDAEISKAQVEIDNLLAFVKKTDCAFTGDVVEESRKAKQRLAQVEGDRIRLQARLNRISARNASLSELAGQCRELHRAIETLSREKLKETYASVLRKVYVRRTDVDLGAPPVDRRSPPRTFQIRLILNTTELMRFGKTNPAEILQLIGFSDIELSVTIAIRNTKDTQNVTLLEHGYTTVAVTFANPILDPVPVVPCPQRPEALNPIQKAVRWKAIIDSGCTLVSVAAQEKVSKGLVSQHLSLLALPECIVSVLKQDTGRTPGKQISLRELQRMASMSAAEAIERFQILQSGRPFQATLPLADGT